MKKIEIAQGRLSMNGRGFGFVEIGGETPDVYVGRENLGGAMHGDVVKIEIAGGGSRPNGKITEIVKRPQQNIVGILMRSKTGLFIIPDDDRFGQSIDITWSDIGDVFNQTVKASVGQKVVARVDKDGRASLAEALGDEDTVGVDILSIIRSHNLYEEFDDEVEAEAVKVAIEIPKKEIERRVDLRKDIVITIDPADAKDLDDAISLEKREDGMWELGVHIADVAHYVTEGSILDAEAFKRGTSVYFPDRVLPMLPRALSNDVCSLNPNVDRLTLSCLMVIDPNGDVVESKVVESVININTRFSYDEVQEILDTNAAEPKARTVGGSELLKKHKKLVPLLEECERLAKIIESKRRTRGEVVFDVPEPKIILDEKTGRIRDVIAYPHLMSHRIVETFMILCNEVVAKTYFDLEMPFIYRVHDKPDLVKVATFIESLKPFGVVHKINFENVTGHAYQKMLDSLDPDVKPIVSQLALRSMQKAKYSELCRGHFGLGSKYYCHFTSPIRRYPDLVIHRIIKMIANRKMSTHKEEQMHDFVIEAAIQSSKTELAATEAEREVDNLKRAEYMSDKIGETFTGTISGIKDFGVFVYLPNTVEGLIRIENMPKDSYTYHEKQMTLNGKRRTYKMGDKIDVVVAGVNLPRRQVEFNAK